METESETHKGFMGFIKKIAAKHQNEVVLFVTHNTLIGNLLISSGFADFCNIERSSIVTSGYIEIGSDGCDIIVKNAIGVNFKNKL